MTLPRLRIARIPAEVASALEERAAALARGEDVGVEEERQAFVEFAIGEARCAVELAAVSKAVVRLGTVVKIAGAPDRVCGVAYVSNLPHVVLDLRRSIGNELAGPHMLSASPALVMRKDGRQVALSVDGPLDLVESFIRHRAEGGAQVEPVAGRLSDGSLLLSTAWLEKWVRDAEAA